MRGKNSIVNTKQWCKGITTYFKQQGPSCEISIFATNQKFLCILWN